MHGRIEVFRRNDQGAMEAVAQFSERAGQRRHLQLTGQGDATLAIFHYPDPSITRTRRGQTHDETL